MAAWGGDDIRNRPEVEEELTPEQLDNLLLGKAVAEGIDAVDKDELLRVMLAKLVSVIRVTNTLGELVEKKPSGLILPEHLN